MSEGGVGYRDRAVLPRLGSVAPRGPVLLDTNVFINALAGRGPPELEALLRSLPMSFLSGPTLAELSWPRGRLDPAHPQTQRVLEAYAQVLVRADPRKILAPSADQWARAGELAGRAARAAAGAVRSIRTAFDRVELINDAATAVVALDAGATIITQDGDFDLFLQLTPALDVLFYD
jgi:predicted nucleic acid-binding protein